MILVLILTVAASAEFMAYLVGKYGILQSRGSYLLADPNVVMSEKEIEKYFSKRDSVLGWPSSKHFGSGDFDTSGARPSPVFPHSGSAHVSLYGDSFTYGTDVDHEHAWGNLLARLIGHRVANYGVPGYGPDQAFLRFRNNVDDGSKIVILGFIGADLIRLLNQDRRLIGNQGGGLLLKPRFILNENQQLTLIPIPPITPDLTQDYLRNSEKYLKHEWFLPGSEYGGAIFEFPYMLSIAQALTKQRAIDFYLNKPGWMEYFTEAHASQALPLLFGIISAFDELAAARDKQLRFVILPSAIHLMYQKANKVSPVRLLTERLTEKEISFLDLTVPILRELEGKEICQIFINTYMLNDCGGHYNEVGNEIVAKIIERALAQWDALQ